MKVDFPTSIKIFNDQNDVDSSCLKFEEIIFEPVLIICGPGYSLEIANQFLCDFDNFPSSILVLKNNSTEELTEIIENIGPKEIAILAIGGGKVCDFSKRLALLSERKLYLFPTVVSNDGLISPIAVLSENGKTVSLPGKMPDHVFIDLKIIRAAPKKYIIAAALDLLSNLSATSDWKYAAEHGDGNLNYLAYQFSRIAAYQLLDCVSWELTSSEFIRAVIHGQILSAMAMAYAGSSRPCSGSEHLISHALDELDLSKDLLHGEKVGRATLFTLYLQGKTNPKINKLFESFNVAVELTYEDLSDNELLNVFRRARTTRPGRRTVLDDYKDEELVNSYRLFEQKKWDVK